MVDRDGIAVDIVLDTDKDVMGSRERGAARFRLSSIVLGPLMVDRVDVLVLRWIFGKSSLKMSYIL